MGKERPLVIFICLCGQSVCDGKSHQVYIVTALRNLLKAGQMMCDNVSQEMAADDFPQLCVVTSLCESLNKGILH